jgi:hypothetical protein
VQTPTKRGCKPVVKNGTAYVGGDASREYHVYPTFGPSHEAGVTAGGLSCWCSPWVEGDYRPQGGSVLIVHRIMN